MSDYKIGYGKQVRGDGSILFSGFVDFYSKFLFCKVRKRMYLQKADFSESYYLSELSYWCFRDEDLDKVKRKTQESLEKYLKKKAASKIVTYDEFA